MSRILMFVPLLLAIGVVLADDVAEAEPVESATEAKARTEEETRPATSATGPQAKTEEETRPVTNSAEEQAKTEKGPKYVSGMSILGNQEAPKSLVIVPWKSSELGDSLGISTMLDDSRQPIDKEVFMRALSYYEIRSEEMP